MKINRWGIGAGVAALVLALGMGPVSAQQKAPDAPKAPAATKPATPPAKPAAPVAKKAPPPPACNAIKDKAGCEARNSDCDWIAEAVIEKGARKGQKQAAYCRKLPAKKAAPAAKAPAKAAAPAPKAAAPAAPKAAPAAPKPAPAPAPAPKN